MIPRLRDLIDLVRAPAALSVPGDVVAGAAAAGTLGARTAGLAGASVCLYWAGMAANDWADRELDAVERPERPIPAGRITAPTALGIAAGLTGAGLALAAATGGRRALGVAVPLAAAVWAYDLRAKNTAAGPVVMAACRGLDVLLGTGAGRRARALPAALAVAAHTYTLTELSRREVSGADPRLPAATLTGTALLAATVAAAGATRRPVPARTAAVSGRRPAARRLGSAARRWAPGLLAAVYAARFGPPQARAVADPSAARIRTSVGAGITSLPALQGALTAAAGAPVVGAAVAAAAPAAARLARKVSPT